MIKEMKNKIMEGVNSLSKPQYYDLTDILEKRAMYNIVYGGRSIGKSYQIKKYCLEKAWNELGQFGLLNRRDDKTVADIKSYFGDMDIREITDGGADSINVRAGVIYFTLDGKKVKDAGNVFYLCKEESYKSMVYSQITDIIFEEFISRKGYLCGEMEMLDSLVSTIFRLREECRVWLIGNTISRIFPYVSSWGMYGITQQKEGTIDIYRREVYNQFKARVDYIEIAVERAKNRVGSARSLSGKGSKLEQGEWETVDCLKISQQELDKCHCMYEFVVTFGGFYFLFKLYRDRQQNYFLHCSRKTTSIKSKTRTIGDLDTIDNLHTKDFTAIVDRERFIFTLLEQDKVYYSDELTAADFQTCYNSILQM